MGADDEAARSAHWWATPWWSLAPQVLAQPINPGWSFGNVVISAANSSAPEVEREVVSRHSYGRQLNRVLDALCVLVDGLPAAVADDPRIHAFRALATEIADIKRQSRSQRLARLREDLERLKAEDEAAWAALADALRR